MFSNELEKIVDSEKKADEILRDAKVNSKKLLDEAGVKAEEIIEMANRNSKSAYEELLLEGNDISDREYEEYIENTKRECQLVIDEAALNLKETAEFIVERIVKDNVHS